MQNSHSLTIAIVSYNSYDAVCKCLGELLRTTRHPVIIVDNASPDGSAEKLKREFENIELIQLPQNIGYGRAANRAIAIAKTPYLLLLNPDMLATGQGVDNLLSQMEKLGSEAAILAPAVTAEDYIRQGLQQREWVIGAAMLLNLDLIRPLGFFDENIFLFYEETDLCMRIRKAGLNIWLDTSNYLKHLYRQSSAPNEKTEALKNWHTGWSQLYFYTKHSLAVGKKRPIRILSLYAIKYITATQKAKRAMYKARLLGIRAFLRGDKAFLQDGTPQHTGKGSSTTSKACEA